MLGKLLGLAVGNKLIVFIVAGLVLSLGITGKLLLSSHEKNGRLNADVDRLESSNEQLEIAHDKRLEEFNQLQQKWIKREDKRVVINEDVASYQQQIKDLPDETNVRDVIYPADRWLLIERSARGERLPVDK